MCFSIYCLKCKPYISEDKGIIPSLIKFLSFISIANVNDDVPRDCEQQSRILNLYSNSISFKFSEGRGLKQCDRTLLCSVDLRYNGGYVSIWKLFISEDFRVESIIATLNSHILLTYFVFSVLTCLFGALARQSRTLLMLSHEIVKPLYVD